MISVSNKELECVKDVMLSNLKTQDIWFDISDGFVETLKEKDREIERLHSITKEVRAKLYDLNYKIKEIYNVPFDISEIFEMIEILDKVGSDKE